MKNMPSLFKRALVLAGVLTVVSGTLAQASVITKANNTLALTNTASWVGGVVPGPGDIAAWDSTVTGANTVVLGTNLDWLGIQIANPGGLVTIANDGSTLTNGTSGINMSAATQGLTLSNNVVLAAGPQNWTVASGQTLTLGGSLLRNGGSGLRFYLPDLSASGALVALTNGTPNWLLGGPTNSTFGNIFFATVNDVDLAALNGSLDVIGGSTVGGLYTQNIANNANPTLNGTTNVVDFVNTTSYGIRCSGASTYFAFRFNVAQTYTGVNAKWVNSIPAWVNDHTSGRNNTIYSILITTNVGSSAVVDYDGATDIIGTAGTRDLLLYQNNPGAPLIFQTAITETGTNNPAFLNKFGAGTVELENQNSYSGGTRIYEGTLKVDAVGDQSLFTTLAIGAPVAFNVNGSLGVSVRTHDTGTFPGSTNSVNVYGGDLTQAAPNTNVIPVTVYIGATNTISLSKANLQLRDGASGLAETLLNSSTNFTLTFNSGSRLQFAYANGIAPSATVAPLFVTNGNNASPLVANGTVTVDVLSGNLAMGQYPLIKYSGTVGGTGGSAFVLGTIEPHALAYLSNNVANNSIDLVVTNIVQPITWAVGNATWDIATTANWSNTVPALTTYQQVGTLGDNVVFDDTATGASPITVTLNVNPTPNSVTFNNASKTYTLSGTGGITGLGSVTKANTGTAFLQTTNSFTGGLNVNGGILNFTTITNLGDGGINFGGGTLQFASGTVDDISVRPVTFNNTGTIDLNGNAVTFANPIGNSGAGGFTLAGNNTLQINGTNRYSGNTVINSGSTLTFQTANTFVSNSAALIVNGTLNGQADTAVTLSTPASQILAGSGKVQGEIAMGNGTTISPVTNGTTGTLTINGDLAINGGTLYMDMVAGGSSDLLAINNTGGIGSGNLTLGSGVNAGTIQLNITGGNLANGPYTLITYSGGLIGGAGYLRLNGFNQAGQLAYLSSSSSSAGSILLNVIEANTNNDVWVGGLNVNAWDVGTTANWITNGVSGGTFANGNTVTFDDSGNAGSAVGLKSVLLPASITLNVTNNNYTFQDGSGTGAGLIVGTASLTINGPTLPTTNVTTILTPNGNSGATTINGSGTTLLVGNGTTTGDIGSGNVANNGTLILDQPDNHIVVGTISGTGKLIQEGSATLTLGVNNTYTGQTIISNANSTLQVGAGGAVGSLGTGAVIDNGLLIVNRSGSVSVTNVSGSGSVAFISGPTITLKNDTYQGGTFITNGSLTLTANEQIPSAATVAGSTGIFGLGGTLNLSGFNQTVNGLSDLGVSTGFITNTATTNLSGVLITNVLTSGNGVLSNNFTYTGLIGDATNKAAVKLVILGPGNVELAAANTYRGGTVLGAGITLTVGGGGGAGISGTTAAGTGSITMSNGTTLFMNGNVTTFPAEPVIIAPNSTVTFAQQNLGNAFNGTVSGDANSTNIIVDTGTQGVTAQNVNGATNSPHTWDAFPGTVQIANGGELRLYSNPGPVGGTNTIFDVEGTGVLHVRTTEYAWLGALIGNGQITAPQSAGANVGNIVIGSKNTDCAYEGNISGNNNIYKTGTGKFTLDGVTNVIITTDPSTGDMVTNTILTNFVSYVGATTVSNGVLAIIAPNSFNGTNFTSFNLAGSSAVLDISSAGYSPDGTNLVTNSVLTLVSPQMLNGFGTLRGSVQAGVGGTLNPGNPGGVITNGTSTGVLSVTNSLEIGGAVNMRLDRTNAVTADELAAGSFTIDGTATVLVTNIGPGLFNGDTFTLFSKPVSGFASVVLPATDPTGATNYVWNNNLAVNGTISLASGGQNPINPNPTNILFGVTNGNLYMSWPPDHTGWFLQAQTNLLSTGLGTNWVNVPGSSQTNAVVMQINPTNGAVFYRMIH